MKHPLSPAVRKIVFSLIPTVVSFAVMIAALLAVSAAWISRNEIVAAGGAQVGLKAQQLEFCYYDTTSGRYVVLDETLDLSSLLPLPGSVATVRFRVRNLSADTLALTALGFAAPTAAEEVPVVHYAEDPLGGDPILTDCYLSTQLRVSYTAGTTPPAPLPEAGDMTTLSNNAVTLFYTGSISLASGASHEFVLTFRFVNDGDQSVYMGYAENGGVCARRFSASFVVTSSRGSRKRLPFHTAPARIPCN